ncbi:MAG: flagellar basal body L-ring protein FlgH [Gammaproteobacteria bacterium]|jgi:flagellar L-ring protein precursor FlgH|nr:flagellar basal body L-ring protein FlgH [Gammaproteobacteria bacterium]
MQVFRSSLLPVGLSALALLAGCATISGPEPGTMPPAVPQPPLLPAGNNGSIYHPSASMSLFGDVRARNIGDTLTVVLQERTQASKSASTEFAKDSDFDSGIPLFAGSPPTFNGDPILQNSFENAQSFDGSGSSSQSNSLTGDITVTVLEVYANGNLLVRGEKWIELNQGKEYVQVSGIVRQFDITPANTVVSSQLADARISYSGSGDIANSNSPGVISKFLNKFWPL